MGINLQINTIGILCPQPLIFNFLWDIYIQLCGHISYYQIGAILTVERNGIENYSQTKLYISVSLRKYGYPVTLVITDLCIYIHNRMPLFF